MCGYSRKNNDQGNVFRDQSKNLNTITNLRKIGLSLRCIQIMLLTVGKVTMKTYEKIIKNFSNM